MASIISNAVVDFSLGVYKLSAVGGENLFMSPSSVYAVMAMIQAGAGAATLEQMTAALKLTGHNRKTQLQLLKEFNTAMMAGSRDVILTTANKLYPNADRKVVEEYIKVLSESFKSEITPMAFSTKPEECRKEINDWVEKQTNKKIKDVLPDGSITSQTGMVVVNAIYFKGEWADKFEPRSTTKTDFHPSASSKVQVDMMKERMDYAKYGESKEMKCKVLQLPYQGKEIGMVLFLPHEVEGLSKLEQALTREHLEKILAESKSETVDVYLPKFKMETQLTLKETLQKLGMVDLFNMAKADLSGIGEQLFVSEVYHKAFVAVDENGTEAAAATAAIMLLGCMIPNRVMEFKADHPFMFMIWDYRIRVPLFIGRVIQP
ncbi:serpin B4-like [Mya arenaria]|nr:serpin B4-like [Mya arenaria]